MNLFRHLVLLGTAFLGMTTAASALPSPTWSRIDTGLGALVAPNGQIAQANAVGDSVWIRVLNADGAIRWTAHWDLKTTRKLWLKALVPTADAGWIVAMDTADGKGSWIARLDSRGRLIGSPMGMRHAECYDLMVTEAPSGGIWVAPSTFDSVPSTLYRFDSLGRFRDSTPLPNWGSLGGIRILGGRPVVWLNQSEARVHHFLRYGAEPRNGTTALPLVYADSLRDATYAAILQVMRDGAGTEQLVFVTDSGTLDVVKGTMPRARVVSWVAELDSLHRAHDETNELVYPKALWIGSDGKPKLAGTRRTAASLAGLPKFEPAVVRLDGNFRQIDAKAVHPGGAPTTDLASIYAGSFPDSSGYLVVSGYDKPTSIALLDGRGDSTADLLLPTIYSVTIWRAQPGRLVGQGQSNDGRTRSIESWSTTGNTAVRATPRRFASLQAVGGRLVAELDHPVATAWLERMDFQGRILESRRVGALPAGRTSWEIADRSPALVRLRVDGQTLVAKVPARLR